jgi:hypothetical protein
VYEYLRKQWLIFPSQSDGMCQQSLLQLHPLYYSHDGLVLKKCCQLKQPNEHGVVDPVCQTAVIPDETLNAYADKVRLTERKAASTQ